MPGAVLFDLGYAGSHGLKFAQDRTFNQLPDSALALGTALQAQVANPFYGQILTGPLSQRTVSRAQLLRPYPQFNGITSSSANWAASSFHSMQLKVEKRYARGFAILGSYTWSKMMDMGAGPFAGKSLASPVLQNWNNLAAEWSTSILDQTHRGLINTVYELPFGKNLKGAPGRLVYGWELGAIFSAYSGGPIAIQSASSTTFAQGGSQRPNWTGVNPTVSNPTPNRWLDASQFSNPPAFAFGNAPRSFNGARGDPLTGLDMTVTKNTQIRERLRLQFRAEFFNITNTPRFNPPNATFGSAQFGVVSAQSNLPRIIQFGMKLLY